MDKNASKCLKIGIYIVLTYINVIKNKLIDFGKFCHFCEHFLAAKSEKVTFLSVNVIISERHFCAM